MVAITLQPASRFVATPATATFPTQIGHTIYSKVERPDASGSLGRDLTWRSAIGAMVSIGGRRFYAPLFFWRKLR